MDLVDWFFNIFVTFHCGYLTNFDYCQLIFVAEEEHARIIVDTIMQKNDPLGDGS